MHPSTRRHTIRVIISEIIMVFAVIITVVVLALIVSGYWLGEGLKVERNGMLQISSIPTGATVTVDGSEWGWLDRTNTSKVVSSGEHTVSLAKDGYDSWSRTINVTEGLLYRIHYPRLFLKDRQSTPVYDTTDYTFATISPNSKFMLLANNTTEWLLLNLESDTLEPKNLDISTLFSAVSLADGASTGLFTGEIVSANWSQDGDHLLLQVTNSDSTEWVLLRPRELKNSINLTKQFSLNFTSLKILDSSASTLLAVRNDNLYRLDVAAKQISSALVQNIASFDHYDSEIVFVAKTPDQPVENSTTDTTSSVPTPQNSTENAISSVHPYYVGSLRLGENKTNFITSLDAPAQIAISKFYDDKYLTLLSGATVTLYQKEDFSERLSGTLGFTPAKLAVGHNGEFIEMTAGTQFATLDMEAQGIREWTIESHHYGWLDHDMLYAVTDGQLIVYDFDGLNRRLLADNASSHFPVTITSDKWLYYFSDGELIRVLIRS